MSPAFPTEGAHLEVAVINAAALGVWTAQQKNNARQGRALLQAFLQNIDSTPLNGVRSGVISTVGSSSITDGLVTFVSGQQLAVQPFSGVAHRTGQGPYLGWLATVANPSVDTPPASNPRNDIVVARFYDAAQGDTVPGGGANPMQIEIITGTPAASPTDPVVANFLGVITSGLGAGGGVAIPLARAQVSTAGVVTLTDLRRSAALIGSVRRLLPGDADSLGSRGDLRMNGNILELCNQSGNWVQGINGADSAPRGILGFPGPATDYTCTSSEAIMPETVTASVVSGRKYKLTHCVDHAIATGSPTSQTHRFRVASGGSITTAGTLIQGFAGPPPGAAHQTATYTTVWQATFTGTATFGIGWFTNGGATLTAFGNSRIFVVEDAGN